MKFILFLTLFWLTASDPLDVLPASIQPFLTKILEKLNRQNPAENLVLSPYSLHIILTMAYLGSQNETQRELGELLELSSEDQTNITEEYKKTLLLYRQLKTRLNTTINLANAIYVDERFSVKPQFQELLRNVFLTKVIQTNFQEKMLAAQAINDWIENKTEGFLQDVISPDLFSTDLSALLVNTVYFHASWLFPFDVSLTEKGFFFTQDGKVTVDFMQVEQDLATKHFSNQGYSATFLPYIGGEFVMLVLSPDNSLVLDRILTTDLGSMNYRELYDTLEPNEVKSVVLKMPKFTIEMKKSLKNILQEAGVTSIFKEGETDLDILIERKVYVSDLLHAAKIEVSEEGTEAAGFSGLFLESRFKSKENLTFDSPFVLAIVDLSRNIPVFVAKVVNPSEGSAEDNHLSAEDDTPLAHSSLEPVERTQSDVSDSSDESCTSSCEHGQCVKGKCICILGFTGSFCQIQELNQKLCFHDAEDEIVVFDGVQSTGEKVLFPCPEQESR